jgi:hypothetical protein
VTFDDFALSASRGDSAAGLSAGKTAFLNDSFLDHSCLTSLPSPVTPDTFNVLNAIFLATVHTIFQAATLSARLPPHFDDDCDIAIAAHLDAIVDKITVIFTTILQSLLPSPPSLAPSPDSHLPIRDGSHVRWDPRGGTDDHLADTIFFSIESGRFTRGIGNMECAGR